MTQKILQALHEVMSTVGYVQKGGKNAFHNYKYAGEADLLEKLRPAMVKAGLLLLPSVTEQSGIDEYGNTRVRIEYTLAHVSGEIWPTPIVAQGCGNDKNKNGVGDKGTYKAITGANKYLLFKLFQIETGDDPERDSAIEQNGNTTAAPSPAPSGSGVTQAEVIRGKPLDAAGWKAKAVALVQAAEDICGTTDNLYQWQLSHQAEIDTIRGRSRALADWVAEGLLKLHEKLKEKAA